MAVILFLLASLLKEKNNQIWTAPSYSYPYFKFHQNPPSCFLSYHRYKKFSYLAQVA